MGTLQCQIQWKQKNFLKLMTEWYKLYRMVQIIQNIAINDLWLNSTFENKYPNITPGIAPISSHIFST